MQLMVKGLLFRESKSICAAEELDQYLLVTTNKFGLYHEELTSP